MKCLGTTNKKNKDLKLSGKLADVNIWSLALSFDVLIAMTNCTISHSPTPDIFQWSNIIRKNVGCATFQNVSKTELCKSAGQVPELILFEHLQEVERASFQCNALGGEFFMPKNEEEFSLLASLVNKSKVCDAR